ncbi:DUF2508 family protein [Chakrabartyella piscis]|uniref:DUF2508 family protein n=1 Tax=Chakrabartyella piscis TaxID=2918914 RepID=UPI00295855C1|nr:DUF2508 family protein [Chakrabartyella piscis]
MAKQKGQNLDLQAEGFAILAAITEVQEQISCAKQGFSAATDERLIDSYIHELIALQKRYEFFLHQAKEMGLTAMQKRIG